MGMKANGDRARPQKCFCVKKPHLVVSLVANIQVSVCRTHSYAGQKRPRSVGGGLNALLKRGSAANIADYVDYSRIASGNKNVFTVSAKGQAIPRFRQRHKLPGLLLGNVEKGQTDVLKAATNR